jgi:hypothetical protein
MAEEESRKPAWALVEGWLRAATREVEVLAEDGGGRETLEFLHVSDRSPLGAVALHTGGLLFDGGQVRVLGAGCGQMKGTLVTWNRGRDLRARGGFLVVGHDAFGGFFLLNGGLLPNAEVGEVLYLAPDSLEFERLEVGYGGFLQFCCQGDLEKFYSWARWPGWRQEVIRLEPDQGLSFYPFLWSEEGKDLAKTTHGAVPMTELWDLAMDTRSQLDKLGPNARVRIGWVNRPTRSGDDHR